MGTLKRKYRFKRSAFQIKILTRKCEVIDLKWIISYTVYKKQNAHFHFSNQITVKIKTSSFLEMLPDGDEEWTKVI